MKSQLLKSIYESNNNTFRMLISLLNKWNDKGYYLNDKEWSTIKEYKGLLDSVHNDTSILEDLIRENEKQIAK